MPVDPIDSKSALVQVMTEYLISYKITRAHNDSIHWDIYASADVYICQWMESLFCRDSYYILQQEPI